MDKDPLTRMENLLKSGVSTDKVLQDMINYLRQKESPPKSDTSLEEMIDDFLEAGNNENERFERAKRIYEELKKKGVDNLNSIYGYVEHKYSDEFKDFNNEDVNRIVSSVGKNDRYKHVILSCAINYSDLDEITIYEDVSKVEYVGWRLGINGHRKKLIVKGDAGDFCGYDMYGGAIYVKGDAKDYCGHKMSGGEIHVEGNAAAVCGYYMYGGEIHVEGNAGGGCGSYMSGGEIRVDGEIVGPIGKNKTGGKIINKGNGY